MDRVDKEYWERMLSLTAAPEWEEFAESLKQDIYQEQSNILDSVKSWDEVLVKRGRCEALAYIANLRPTIKQILDSEL